jgi:hypothetical protein
MGGGPAQRGHIHPSILASGSKRSVPCAAPEAKATPRADHISANQKTENLPERHAPQKTKTAALAGAIEREQWGCMKNARIRRLTLHTVDCHDNVHVNASQEGKGACQPKEHATPAFAKTTPNPLMLYVQVHTAQSDRSCRERAYRQL